MTSPADARPALPRPNIVFVFADQMRAQATGYASDPNVKTPYLDRLAGESIDLRNAVASCPVCTPYRASLLSGQYPLTHGLFLNDLCLPDNGHSLGQELRRGGYETAWIGKWHIDGHGRGAPIPPQRRLGFDYWRVLECTHDYNSSQYYAGDDIQPRFWHGYDAYAQTDDAIQHIRRRAAATGATPFALFLSFGTPHDPYETAPAELRMLYPGTDLRLRENVAAHREPQAREQLTGYYAHITAIDRCLQRLDGALDAADLHDHTVFVFTSDHDDMLESQWQASDAQRGVRKQVPYDESVRVPFLLRYPARFGTAGRQVLDPIATPDIMPTLLGLTGLRIPHTVQGVDMSPVLDGGRSGTVREGVLLASYHPFADWRTARGGRPYRGIRTRRHSLVRDRNGPWMLFDNHDDPFQMENLVNRGSTAAVQRRLDEELAALLAAHGDRFESPHELRARFGYTVRDDEAIPYT